MDQHLRAFDLLRQLHECLCDINASKRGALINVKQLVLFRKQLCLLTHHLALLGSTEHDVKLVGHQGYDALIFDYLAHLVKPKLEVDEGTEVGDVVDQDDAEGTSVVVASNRSILLTACSVPYLQIGLHIVLQSDHFLNKVDPYRWRVFNKFIRQKSVNNVRLPRVAVTGENNLEQDIVVFLDGLGWLQLVVFRWQELSSEPRRSLYAWQ